MSVQKKRKLAIIGCSEFALIACDYFTFDSDYEVVCFSVEREYVRESQVAGLPVVPLESLTETYPPHTVDVHVAVAYAQLNRLRTRLYRTALTAGYQFANYVSSHAFVWHNVTLGSNVFIFENNVVQPFVEIGDNVILWSGNHIGHRTVIEDNCYISSHVVISGFCRIGNSSFIGVNASLGDHITVERDCLVGMGAVINRTCEAGRIYVGNPATPAKTSALKYFKVDK